MVEVAFNIVQQAVHQCQTTGAGHQFEADKRAVDLKSCVSPSKVVRSLVCDLTLSGRLQSKSPPYLPPGPATTSTRLRFQQMNNGFNQRTPGWKYWPAPDLVSFAFFCNSPSVHIAEVIARLTVRAVVPVQRIHIADQCGYLFRLGDGGTNIMKNCLYQLLSSSPKCTSIFGRTATALADAGFQSSQR